MPREFIERQTFVDRVVEALTQHLTSARELRKLLHATPELSWREFVTSGLISQALQNLDVTPVADTGLIVRIGGVDAPTIAIRAELDGLPVIERTSAIFASTNGSMHACGHDVHMAALVAVLRAINDVLIDSDPGFAVLGVFQPSEEASPSGAVRIIEAPVYRDQRPRVMLGLHVHPGVAWGACTTGAGAVNAGSDTFELTVSGAGGHGAYPHHAHDPVLALSSIIVAFQQVVSRRVDPMHPTVVTVATLHAGTASNVIPDEAIARGTVRVLIPEDRDTVLALLEDTALHTAAAHGCAARFVIDQGDPVLFNAANLVHCVDPWLVRVGLDVAEPMRSCGADDFAYYGSMCPSLMMFLGVNAHCGSVEDVDALEHESPSLHHARFLPDPEVIQRAALAMIAGIAGAAEMIVSSPES